MNEPIAIHQPTEEEKSAALKEFVEQMREIRQARAKATAAAIPALKNLCAAMAGKTGQSYHLRKLLYSLWNGAPKSLSDTLNLDWDLKCHFAVVLLAFGDDAFFYDAVSNELKRHGLFDWFVAEHEGGAQ